MKHSKDLKLIIALLCLETILILVLSVIAVVKYRPGSGSDTGKETVLSGVNVGSVLFPDSGRLNIGSDAEPVASKPSATDPGSVTPAPTEASTPEPEIFNYYTFEFSESGYRSSELIKSDDSCSESGCTRVDVTEKKLTVPASKNELFLGNIKIANDYVNKTLSLPEIFAQPLKLKPMTKNGSNQFIVFYTHTYEGYCLTEEEQLHEKRWYTTDDNTSNVVAAGSAYYSKLNLLGINGVNDTTVHNDGSDALKSYELSYVTLKNDLEANTDTRLVLDVHRNGYGKLYKGKLYGPTAEKDEQKYAHIMFVIGLDYDSSTGYSEENNPYWKENFKLAFLILEKMEERVPGITDGIALRKTPYNQGLCVNSLLAEIGFEGNLASEAERTAELLAEVIAEIYS